MNNLVKKAIAEFIGTFALVTFGVGVAILTGNVLTTAVAFGFVLLIMYYTIGKISGCHINPAVTIAMLINKSIKVVPAIIYIIVQILGAIAGTYFLQYALKPIQNDTTYKYEQYKIVYQFDQAKDYYLSSGYSDEQADLLVEKDTDSLKEGLVVNPDNFESFGSNNVVADTTNGKIVSLIIEVFLTFIFVLTVCKISSCSRYARIGGVVVGFALTLVHLMGILLTGTSVNPARSIGPAIVVGGEALKNLWVFVVGPLVGGVLAALVSKFVLNDSEETKEIEASTQTPEEA